MCEFISGAKNAGDTLSALLEMEALIDNDKKAASALLSLCYNAENKNGLVSILRSQHMRGHISIARKKMFVADFVENGPQFR